ncbi:glutamyl-tRNA reductase [Candidatus Saganbacteria bacterium]|nr:glutamyl-tRNA reductase [Candidatus Saganbacteria bacterium]
MQLRVVGLNHKTAPVEVREKIAIPSNRLKEAMTYFQNAAEVKGNGIVIISTCNRTELYSVGHDFDALIVFIENYFKIWFSEIEKYIYKYSGPKAIEHLMRVASGLDSMIVGEGQVLGQVKDSYQAALELKTTNSLLSTVFNRAINSGKRSRTETQITRGAVSVGSAAVELARKIFGDLELRQVLIIGAGKMSEVAASLLKSKVVFVANRTYSRAEELAKKIGGNAVKFDELDKYLETCDIVISSTGSSHYIINRTRIQNVLHKRGNNPLFLIDIAVPRDIDPQIGELSSVYLYDIDDLNSIAAENLRARQSEIPKVEMIISEEKENVIKWQKRSRSEHAEAVLQ